MIWTKFCQYCLLHWVTVTNRNLVCCQKVAPSESMQQTKTLIVPLSHCDKQNLYMLPKSCQKCQQCSTFGTFNSFWHFSGLLGLILHLLRTFFWCFLELFGNIFYFFLQWLSATTKNCVCCSGSVPQTKICLLQWIRATNNCEKNIKFLCCM